MYFKSNLLQVIYTPPPPPPTHTHTDLYTAVQKYGISKMFNGVSYAHQGCIYLIKNTEKNSNNVKYYCNF